MRQKRFPNYSRSLGLSIVIPVHNEADNIEETLQSIRKNITVPHEIIVVYDSDEDTTLPILHRIIHTYDNVRLVKNNVIKGPSGAIRTGFSHARFSRVLVTMADLCDDLTQVPQLLQLVPTVADIACPSRYCKGGQQLLPDRFKVWIPRMAGFFLRLLTGIPTNDPTNSYKLYSAKLLHAITLTSTISFSVTLEIMAKAHCLNYRIAEVPTVWRDRMHGKTNFKLGRSLVAYFPWFCLALLRNRLFRIPISWVRLFMIPYPS